jgi:hypothetical protein
MNIIVFDTETTSINKPFCYNIGYKIVNAESRETLVRRDYVVEQVWQNLELFTTAYYESKRQVYVNRMRARKVIQEKFGYICRQMYRDIKSFEIENGYAYNSTFDIGVFEFCCEWYKVQNPLDNIKVHDIWGFVSAFISNTEDYKFFCETNELFTESGNYSASAESVYKYITRNLDFVEEHTALADSEIESEILLHCVKTYGAILGEHYKTYKNIPRLIDKVMNIVVDGEIIDTITYKTKRVYDNKIIFHTQGK